MAYASTATVSSLTVATAKGSTLYSRVRVTGSLTLPGPTCTETHEFIDPQASPVLIESMYCRYGEQHTTCDNPTPGFARLRNKGVIINNPFSSVYERHEFSTGSRVHSNNGSDPSQTKKSITRDLGNNGNWYDRGLPPVDLESLITQACTQALANIEAPDVEGIPFLVELRQSLDALRHPLDGAIRFMDGLSRGGSRGFGLSARGAADQHLTLVFGLMPFFRDLEALLKSIHQPVRSKRRTARGSASESASSLSTGTYNDGIVEGTIEYQRNVSYVVRAGCLYEVSFDLGLSRLGLTIGSIPAAMWELLPYSFVVDWLSNVGDFISAITPQVGVTRLAEWYTVEQDSTSVATLTSITRTIQPSGMTATGGGDTRTRVVKAKTRKPCNLGDRLGLVFNPRLDTSKVLAAISLLTQKVTSYSRSIPTSNRNRRLR